jgi:hypothetical protein
VYIEMQKESSMTLGRFAWDLRAWLSSPGKPQNPVIGTPWVIIGQVFENGCWGKPD